MRSRRSRLAAELLVALGPWLLGACDEGATRPMAPPRERSQAVVGATTAAAAATTTRPAASGRVAPRARNLCGGRLAPPGREVPRSPIGRAAAPGVAEPPETVTVGGGRFTWINFWAAWCEPCKEEVPRLLAWQGALGAKGIPLRVVFVTLDDDERQLRAFLGAQPADGLRATWWLREGKERERWLLDLGLEPDPALPVHVIADAAGKARCTIAGAVEDGDYAAVAALLAK
jgi:thiol-disulfide isomerase/thioredoxin